jgi:hypothetical protein
MSRTQYTSPDFKGNVVVGVGAPAANTDAANKKYVDDKIVINAAAPTLNNLLWVDIDDTSLPPAAAVGNPVIVLTQAAYDALAIKDPNTVYVTI